MTFFRLPTAVPRILSMSMGPMASLSSALNKMVEELIELIWPQGVGRENWPGQMGGHKLAKAKFRPPKIDLANLHTLNWAAQNWINSTVYLFIVCVKVWYPYKKQTKIVSWVGGTIWNSRPWLITYYLWLEQTFGYKLYEEVSFGFWTSIKTLWYNRKSPFWPDLWLNWSSMYNFS